jgi:vacuolar protein sorting-associated protein 26
MNSPIKMEVGIEDCLHIEFEYNKSKYHLKDVIVGKIYFLLVRIKIKHMEIAIIKRETTGAGEFITFSRKFHQNNTKFHQNNTKLQSILGSNVFTENETIAKYEIMDGAPVKGESIPIRVFLAGYDLTPTMRDINKKFSVRYFLNLVLMDTEDRRYFKQQEITLWRKSEKTRKSLSNSGSGAIGGGSGSSSNLTVAQQNAQMPTHLVQGTSAIHPPMLESIGGPLGNPTTSPGVSQTEQSHMGLFTEEEDSPQHEATESKVRSNPLAFDTDEDKTPSKEENPPVPTSKEPPQQQQSIGESSSLFEFSNDAAVTEPPPVTNSNSEEPTPAPESTATTTEDASTTN